MTETTKEKIVKYIQDTIHPNDYYDLFVTITDKKTNEVHRVCGLGIPPEGYQYHCQDYRFPMEAADRNFKGIEIKIIKETEHGMLTFNLNKFLDEESYSFNVTKIPKNKMDWYND